MAIAVFNEKTMRYHDPESGRMVKTPKEETEAPKAAGSNLGASSIVSALRTEFKGLNAHLAFRFDSVIEAFTGTCGALTSIDCDDDGAATANFSELSLTGLVAGEIVYFRVWEYGGDEVEAFSVSAFNATLSVGDFENEAAFTYYPNPVKNTLTLNAKNTIEQVAMYNMLGQEVLRANPNTLNSNLDMSTLQTGTYFVKVTIGNVTETIRVMKQ